MPTPFYHLSVAEELLAHPGLPSQAHHILRRQRAAFLLGNTAPDVQTVSGQAREETHFFDLPIQPEHPPAWEQMLVVHPVLAHSAGLPPAQAAFLGGYLCHLQADWGWVTEIFAPVFGRHGSCGALPQRALLHNILRAYLDRRVLADLPAGLGSLLAQAEPHGWLPFVADRHLQQWRDWLAGQLLPGAAPQTVEVFAARQGISPAAFYRLMDSEAGMEREVFALLPRRDLQEYRRRLVEANLELLSTYLAPIQLGSSHRLPRSCGPCARQSPQERPQAAQLRRPDPL